MASRCAGSPVNHLSGPAAFASRLNTCLKNRAGVWQLRTSVGLTCVDQVQSRRALVQVVECGDLADGFADFPGRNILSTMVDHG